MSWLSPDLLFYPLQAAPLASLTPTHVHFARRCLNAGSSAIPNGTKAHNIQVISNPGNGANVWWGAHCLDGWLEDPSRKPTDWDVITFK